MQGSAPGMRHQYGLGRDSNSIRCGAVTAVAEVDSDSNVVHLFHCRDSCFGQSRVCRFKTTGTQGVPFVICDLHNAHIPLAELLDHFEAVFEYGSLLETLYDSKFSFLFCTGNI